MSRAYGMELRMYDVQSERIDAIKASAENEWPFQDWTQGEEDGQRNLAACGESSLCGGESEEEFTDRLAAAIWQANGTFCRVTVYATFLEELPYDNLCSLNCDYFVGIRPGFQSSTFG